MNVHVMELANGKHIVADVEELPEEPSAYLKNCREIVEDIVGNITLKKWPKYTDEPDVLIYSKSIFTISEPTAHLLEKYKESINS
jgi:hypothetical protein